MTTKYWIYQETTQWDEPTPNHVYVFTEQPKSRTARCMGYVKQGTKTLFKFKKPYDIDLRGRTFKELA